MTEPRWVKLYHAYEKQEIHLIFLLDPQLKRDQMEDKDMDGG
jgi:hypothetical protein